MTRHNPALLPGGERPQIIHRNPGIATGAARSRCLKTVTPKSVYQAAIALTALVLGISGANASGILRNAVGARSLGLGGADIALADDPLTIMHANPAGLGFVNDVTLSAGATAGLLDGKFSNPANNSGSLGTFAGALPEGALLLPIKDFPVKFGLSFIPEGIIAADWRYKDSRGGLSGNTVYDATQHKSQIMLLRSAIGAGYAFNEKISVGASFGILYNENVLEAPYIFQTNPQLGGAKTLLDLHTSGVGFDGQGGVLIKPVEDWQVGLSYRSRSVIKTTGTANGTAGAEFAALGVNADPYYNYDAQVVNVFPQTASVGVQWQAVPSLKLLAQVDWIDWSSSFHNLRIHLSNGNNPTVNFLANGNVVDDSVPLNWRDQFVYRTGFEWAACKAATLRAGYSYARNPVPAGTLTPLTAAIFEHTIGVGMGCHFNSYTIDFGYEYDLPTKQSVGISDLKSGEYNHSEIEVSAHVLALTLSKRL
ncbi:MAG TPA: outer membrane protein transport protein [Candidatus Limnocylindria bacterium]|nr:outer membrane protein transport protein [Candidatus Limnocylindria bacterium]